MDQQMKISSKIPLFGGEDYAFWSIRMKSYLMAIELEVWTIVEKGYDVPKFSPIEAEDKKKFWEHVKALNNLQSRLEKKVLNKVLTCTNEKRLWDKLETIYARDSKVKREKLQTFKAQFECLKMKDEENILEYFERVDNILNAIKGLGVDAPKNEIVEKILRRQK